jgi:hypothetical protein
MVDDDYLHQRTSNQGSWARDAFNALSAENQDAMIHNIVVFSITLVNELR